MFAMRSGAGARLLEVERPKSCDGGLVQHRPSAIATAIAVRRRSLNQITTAPNLFMLALLTTTLSLVAPLAPSPQPPLAFAFSPAGLLFPYYIGVSFRLRELGLLTDSCPLGGSSAGAIIAATMACGVSEREVIDGLSALLEDVRGGTRLNEALRKQLDSFLSDDAHKLAQQHGLKIGYLEVLPLPRRHVVTEWESKQDLIDCIAASCNW